MPKHALPFKLPFTHYAQLGYLPCPVNGKVPTGGVGWYQKQYDYAELDGTGQNVGLRCENIVAFDIDIEDADHAQAIEDVVRQALDLPADTPVRVGQAPKRLLIARVEEPTKGFDLSYRDAEGHGHTLFQLLGSGKQFVIHGIHPGTGKPYTLSTALPAWEKLPPVTPEDLEQVRLRVVQTLTRLGYTLGSGGTRGAPSVTGAFSGPVWNLAADIRDVAEALERIDPRCDRKTWLDVAMALHDGFHGSEEGLGWFVRWSSGDLHEIEVEPPKYKGERDCRRQWNGFKPGGGITRATLFHTADRGEFLFHDDSDEVPTDSSEVPAETYQLGRDLYDLFLLNPGGVPWIVEGMLTHGAHLLVGRPKGGKSWLTLDLAYACAAGGAFLDKPTREVGVLWIAAEDTLEGLGRRVRVRGELPPKGNVIVMTMEALRAERGRCPNSLTFQQWLRAFLSAQPGIEVVIMDTHATVEAIWSGEAGDTRKISVVDKAYDATRQYDQIGLDTQTCIVLVHHQGKMKNNTGTDYHERVNLPAVVVAGATGSIVLADLPDKDIHEEEDYQRVVALRGRHIRDEVLQIELRNGKAQLLGSYIEMKQSETQQDVLNALESLLRERGWPTKEAWATFKEIAQELGKHERTVAASFKTMRKDPAKLRWKDHAVVTKPKFGVTLK
jgi:RecA-family ATPase